MSQFLDRRDFVTVSTTATLAGLFDAGLLAHLRPLSAQDVRLERKVVPLSPDIEPLVRLIEDSPRDKLLEAIAERIRKGVGYQELMAATMLAGVRGIQPRPVGFKFHAVLVINSAHLASLASEDRDRWLPLFWCLDNFKESQARNKAEGDWRMPPVEGSKLPPPHRAEEAFIEAMESWDEAALDVAIVSLTRSAGAARIAELLWKYGARDFRDIGHKAIYAANAWRTLQTIGWRHAEPVLRSLAYALLDRGGDGNPAQNDFPADRPFRDNPRRAQAIRKLWFEGTPVVDAARELLQIMRSASPGEAAEAVVALLNRNVSFTSVWDGLFLFAGELLMRQPGILGLHCVTMTNALHYAFQASAVDETRRLLMLQAASFLSMFRQRMGNLPKNVTIDGLEQAPALAAASAQDRMQETFAAIGKDRMAAAQSLLAALNSKVISPEVFMAGARRLIFTKGTNSHDYKFSSAALEDYYHVSPELRNRFLASSVFNLRGSTEANNPLVERTLAAFRG